MFALPPAQADQCLASPTLPPTPPPVVPVGPHDHAAQREWEQWQTRKGIERYRNSLVKFHEDGSSKRRTLDVLEPGQVIAQELIGPLVKALQAHQTQLAEAIAGQARVSDGDWLLAVMPAETLGAVTVLSALMRADGPSSFTGTARTLAGRVQDEYDLMQWKMREAAAAKERKVTGAEPTPNLYRLMVQRNDKVDRRVFKKWSRKAPLFSSGEWGQPLKTEIGTTLLALLVQSNAWFEVVMERQSATRTQRVFRMTEPGLAWVSDRHNQNELIRPYLLPMICEPRDHEYPEVPFVSLEVA